MNKLSLACSVLSEKECKSLVESLKRKDGSVPVRTFIREAFDIDRLKTCVHEAGHVVIGFLFGDRLGEDGVRTTRVGGSIVAVAGAIGRSRMAPC